MHHCFSGDKPFVVLRYLLSAARLREVEDPDVEVCRICEGFVIGVFEWVVCVSKYLFRLHPHSVFAKKRLFLERG